jgi:type IV pilus assembly protein PilN
MIRVNLLPVEEAERAAERRQHLAMGSLVLGVVALLFVAAHVWQTARFASANSRLASLDKELTALAGPFADVTRMEQQKLELREKLRVIGQLEARKVGPVRILADLSGAAPDKLWLTEYADSSGQLRLTGLGADEQTVADFLRRLGTLPFFQNVDLEETSQVNQDGAKLKKFVIRGTLDYAGSAPATETASNAPVRRAPAPAGRSGGH